MKKQMMHIQGVFFNWSYPKNHKFFLVSKFWHLELFWWDLLCNLTLLGGSQLKKTPCIINTKSLNILLTLNPWWSSPSFREESVAHVHCGQLCYVYWIGHNVLLQNLTEAKFMFKTWSFGQWTPCSLIQGLFDCVEL